WRLADVLLRGPPPPEIPTLSLHDALPIYSLQLVLAREVLEALGFRVRPGAHYGDRRGHLAGGDEARAADINAAFADPEVRAVVRSEEHTSELQSRENLVCRLLLEKKKQLA